MPNILPSVTPNQLSAYGLQQEYETLYNEIQMVMNELAKDIASGLPDFNLVQNINDIDNAVSMLQQDSGSDPDLLAALSQVVGNVKEAAACAANGDLQGALNVFTNKMVPSEDKVIDRIYVMEGGSEAGSTLKTDFYRIMHDIGALIEAIANGGDIAGAMAALRADIGTMKADAGIERESLLSSLITLGSDLDQDQSYIDQKRTGQAGAYLLLTVVPYLVETLGEEVYNS